MTRYFTSPQRLSLASAVTTSISSSTFDGPGTIRILGEATLTGVDVDDDATFANGGSVVQSGIVNDGSLIRNLTTWSVDAGAEIAGADPAAQFVNFGAFDALGAPTDTNLISTNFLDYGTLDYAGTLEFSGPNTLINVGGLPLGLADAGTRIMAINGGNRSLSLGDFSGGGRRRRPLWRRRRRRPVHRRREQRPHRVRRGNTGPLFVRLREHVRRFQLPRTGRDGWRDDIHRRRRAGRIRKPGGVDDRWRHSRSRRSFGFRRHYRVCLGRPACSSPPMSAKPT